MKVKWEETGERKGGGASNNFFQRLVLVYQLLVYPLIGQIWQVISTILTAGLFCHSERWRAASTRVKLLYGQGARTGFSHAALARSISDTNSECENPVQGPCPWSHLFISYILCEHFFSLFRKNGKRIKKQGPAQTKYPKKYIIRWALQMLWVEILTKNWSKMKYNSWLKIVYDDYIIKRPLKHRMVLSIELTKNVTAMVQAAGGLSSSEGSWTRLMRF